MNTYIVLLSTCFMCVSSSLLPSADKILELTKFERQLLVNFNKYIEEKSHWISIIKWEFEDLLKEVPVKVADEEYIGHVLNQWHLVRRLDKRWPRLLALASNDTVLQRTKVKFTREMSNFEGYTTYLLKNILKIQNIYNLSVKSMAAGYISHKKSYGNMTADDCFTIARHYFHNTLMFDDAIKWLNASLTKINKNRDVSTTPVQVKEYMFLSKCFTGDQTAAMTEYRRILETEASFLPSETLRKDYALAFTGCKKAAEELQKARRKVM